MMMLMVWIVVSLGGRMLVMSGIGLVGFLYC